MIITSLREEGKKDAGEAVHRLKHRVFLVF